MSARRCGGMRVKARRFGPGAGCNRRSHKRGRDTRFVVESCGGRVAGKEPCKSAVREQKKKARGKGAERKGGMYWESVEDLEVEKAEAQRRFAREEKAKVELFTGVNIGETEEIAPIFRDVPV